MKMKTHPSVEIMIGLFVAALLGTSCGGKSVVPSGLRVVGAYDMTPLAQAVQNDFQQATGLEMTIRSSTTSLRDLKSGAADVVILGREPSPAEVQSLQDTVVGYDAVCLVINARTYNGGFTEMVAGGLITPEYKFAGIQNLTLDQVKNLEANLLLVNHDDSHWFLPSPALFQYQGYYDPITNAPVVDPSQPDLLQGTWVWNSVDFPGENLPPGKFDTQSVLMSRLGFSESLLNNPHLSFVTSLYDSEEELISARYQVPSSIQMREQVSSYPFDFFIRQVSRRVTLRALQYGFMLNALSVDGIAPLADPKVIYDGSYPFSRRIHILVREPSAKDALKLVNYLLSPQGQELIKAAGYLPLPPVP